MVLVNTTRQGGKSLRSAKFGPCCMRVRSPTPTRAIASQYMISCISVLHFFWCCIQRSGWWHWGSSAEAPSTAQSVTLAENLARTGIYTRPAVRLGTLV